jgi:ubiquinone/menaquinone biosynthesis C-methylase UbiE
MDRKELGPILNAASKEDPGQIGAKTGAINLDICTFDEQTKTELKSIPNFVHGSVLDMSELYEDGHFRTVILGEFIEHAVYGAALQAMKECYRVLSDDGVLCLTFPLDDRPAEAQHAKHLLKVWVEGETGKDVVVWHQHVWEDDELKKLFEESGFVEIHRQQLGYGFVKGRKPEGWGVLLAKG